MRAKIMYMVGMFVASTLPAVADPYLICNEGWEAAQVARDIHVNKLQLEHAMARTNEEVYNLTRAESACGIVEIVKAEMVGFYTVFEVPGGLTVVILKIRIDVIVDQLQLAPGLTMDHLVKTHDFFQFAIDLESTEKLRMRILGEKPA